MGRCSKSISKSSLQLLMLRQPDSGDHTDFVAKHVAQVAGCSRTTLWKHKDFVDHVLQS